MQRASQMAQVAVQIGSLAIAALSQVPRDNDENKALFAEARHLLHQSFEKGLEQLQEPSEEPSDEDEEIDVA